MDEITGKTGRREKAAKRARNNTPEGQALMSGDHKQKRSDLAQKRDAIARDDVEEQIQRFFR